MRLADANELLLGDEPLGDQKGIMIWNCYLSLGLSDGGDPFRQALDIFCLIFPISRASDTTVPRQI